MERRVHSQIPEDAEIPDDGFGGEGFGYAEPYALQRNTAPAKAVERHPIHITRNSLNFLIPLAVTAVTFSIVVINIINTPDPISHSLTPTANYPATVVMATRIAEYLPTIDARLTQTAMATSQAGSDDFFNSGGTIPQYAPTSTATPEPAP